MQRWRTYGRSSVVAIALAAAFGACDQQLESGAACPSLCPTPPLQLRDTTFFAVALDTSIAGFPALGNELQLYIASMGDTLQTRGIVRFDTLPQTFRHKFSAGDTAIVAIDTGAILKLRLVSSDTLAAPATVEAYDVDMGGPDDADPNAVGPGFTPDRLLGSVAYTTTSVKDSVKIPIDPAKLLAKVKATPPANRLRVGIKVTAARKARLTVIATSGANFYGVPSPRLIFHPARDTSVALDTVVPYSKTPASDDFLRASLTNYTYVDKAPPPAPADVLRIGGIPARRIYFAFDIPSRILDSSNVVRATLQLTQRPNRFSPEPLDTIATQQLAITASPIVTDLSRVLQLVSPLGTDTIRLVPSDSGVREFEMVGQMRAWRGTSVARTRRALALSVLREMRTARTIDFFSVKGQIDVRPRLRLTYVPQTLGALP